MLNGSWNCESGFNVEFADTRGIVCISVFNSFTILI